MGLDRIWITRARPGAEATAARLTALGFTPVIAPLLEVRPLPAEIELTGVDALAFTSINAVAAFSVLSPDRTRPVLAVGDATARAATEAGFARVRSADGDLDALAALIRAETNGLSILHPCAAEPAGDLSALVGGQARVRALPLYQTVPTDETEPTSWGAVLIHSPRAARVLAALGPRTADRLACAISPAAARPLEALGFAELRVAAAPVEAALLETLGKPGPGV